MAKPAILIIEDDPRLADIYGKTLQQAGFDTVIDLDGNRYADELSTVHPAVIILDLHMPFASGLDILKQLHSDERVSQVPVIVITADLLLARSIQGQAEEILLKPVSVERLRKTILRFCPGSVPDES